MRLQISATKAEVLTSYFMSCAESPHEDWTLRVWKLDIWIQPHSRPRWVRWGFHVRVWMLRLVPGTESKVHCAWRHQGLTCMQDSTLCDNLNPESVEEFSLLSPQHKWIKLEFIFCFLRLSFQTLNLRLVSDILNLLNTVLQAGISGLNATLLLFSDSCFRTETSRKFSVKKDESAVMYEKNRRVKIYPDWKCRKGNPKEPRNMSRPQALNQPCSCGSVVKNRKWSLSCDAAEYEVLQCLTHLLDALHKPLLNLFYGE